MNFFYKLESEVKDSRENRDYINHVAPAKVILSLLAGNFVMKFPTRRFKVTVAVWKRPFFRCHVIFQIAVLSWALNPRPQVCKYKFTGSPVSTHLTRKQRQSLNKFKNAREVHTTTNKIAFNGSFGTYNSGNGFVPFKSPSITELHSPFIAFT